LLVPAAIIDATTARKCRTLANVAGYFGEAAEDEPDISPENTQLTDSEKEAPPTEPYPPKRQGKDKRASGFVVRAEFFVVETARSQSKQFWISPLYCSEREGSGGPRSAQAAIHIESKGFACCICHGTPFYTPTLYPNVLGGLNRAKAHHLEPLRPITAADVF
jgi:hypothetical protein